MTQQQIQEQTEAGFPPRPTGPTAQPTSVTLDDRRLGQLIDAMTPEARSEFEAERQRLRWLYDETFGPIIRRAPPLRDLQELTRLAFGFSVPAYFSNPRIHLLVNVAYPDADRLGRLWLPRLRTEFASRVGYMPSPDEEQMLLGVVMRRLSYSNNTAVAIEERLAEAQETLALSPGEVMGGLATEIAAKRLRGEQQAVRQPPPPEQAAQESELDAEWRQYWGDFDTAPMTDEERRALQRIGDLIGSDDPDDIKDLATIDDLPRRVAAFFYGTGRIEFLKNPNLAGDDLESLIAAQVERAVFLDPTQKATFMGGRKQIQADVQNALFLNPGAARRGIGALVTEAVRARLTTEFNDDVKNLIKNEINERLRRLRRDSDVWRTPLLAMDAEDLQNIADDAYRALTRPMFRENPDGTFSNMAVNPLLLSPDEIKAGAQRALESYTAVMLTEAHRVNAEAQGAKTRAATLEADLMAMFMESVKDSPYLNDLRRAAAGLHVTPEELIMQVKVAAKGAGITGEDFPAGNALVLFAAQQGASFMGAGTGRDEILASLQKIQRAEADKALVVAAQAAGQPAGQPRAGAATGRPAPAAGTLAEFEEQQLAGIVPGLQLSILKSLLEARAAGAPALQGMSDEDIQAEAVKRALDTAKQQIAPVLAVREEEIKADQQRQLEADRKRDADLKAEMEKQQLSKRLSIARQLVVGGTPARFANAAAGAIGTPEARLSTFDAILKSLQEAQKTQGGGLVSGIQREESRLGIGGEGTLASLSEQEVIFEAMRRAKETSEIEEGRSAVIQVDEGARNRYLTAAREEEARRQGLQEKPRRVRVIRR